MASGAWTAEARDGRVGASAAAPGRPVGRLVGRIARVERHQGRGGSRCAVVTVMRASGAPPVDVLVRDPGLLRSLGLDGAVPNRPLRDRIVGFGVTVGADGALVADSLDDFGLAAAPVEVRADRPGLVPAVARVSARLAIPGLVARARALAGLVPGVRRGMDEVEAAAKALEGVRERRLGADSERAAMERVLRAVVEAASGAIPDRKGPWARRVGEVAGEARVMRAALRKSLAEARAGGVPDLARSAAVRELLPADAAGRQQVAAMVAWSAHQAIGAEDREGRHDGALEAVKACLVRAQAPDADAGREIGQALRHAARGLARLREDVRRDPILSDALAAAIRNVAAACAWIGAPAPGLDPVDEAQRLAGDGPEAELLAVIAEQREAGNAVLGVEPQPGGGVRARFAGGETAVLHRTGEIRLLDADGRLALLQIPGCAPRRFVDGLPIDEAAVAAAARPAARA